ncbi:hypothetical protein [Serratia quinivorans]|uniref:hypothetical protein n=1 Tax=Serratia quinivorans TaxID=137545 RepID=UPI003F9BD595
MDKLHEESRKQFEEWAEHTYSGGNMFLRVGPHKEAYHQTIIQELWEAWQASRASIVVDLPKLSGEPTHLIGDMRSSRAIAFKRKKARDRVINECADAIRSIGLSIKGE